MCLVHTAMHLPTQIQITLGDLMPGEIYTGGRRTVGDAGVGAGIVDAGSFANGGGVESGVCAVADVARGAGAGAVRGTGVGLNAWPGA